MGPYLKSLRLGEFLKVHAVDSNGDVGFGTSVDPDVFWDGNHLISRTQNKALDIYDVHTKNVKLWKFNGHENQKWLATTLLPKADAFEYTMIDKTGQHTSFFSISKPTSLVYRGQELIIDNFIFFSGGALLHNTEPQIRMPALLMTESTFQQIVMNPNMTHHGAFGSDFKKMSLKTLVSGQVGGTFDIGLSATNWMVVWKFPSDMFQIPIWTRDVRSEFALPVGYYPLYPDFGPIVQSHAQMPIHSLVLKMRQKVTGIDLHTLKHLSEATIPMLSFNYFFSRNVEHTHRRGTEQCCQRLYGNETTQHTRLSMSWSTSCRNRILHTQQQSCDLRNALTVAVR